MTKAVFSVSMEVEQAERYKQLAGDEGLSFSAMVSRLARAGESVERALSAEPPGARPSTERGASPLPKARSAAPAEQTPEDRPLLERVYNALTAEAQDLVSLAVGLGVEEDELASAMGELESQGEPARCRYIDGRFQCWVQS